MNEAEAMSLLNKIILEVINIFLRRNILLYIYKYLIKNQLQKRFMVNLPSFHVRLINQKGIKDLPTIYAKSAQPSTEQRTESMDI